MEDNITLNRNRGDDSTSMSSAEDGSTDNDDQSQGGAVEHVEGEESNIRQVEGREEDMQGNNVQTPASIEDELNRIDDIMEEQAAEHDEYEEMMEREADMMERAAEEHEDMLEHEAEMIDHAAEEHEEITDRAAAAHEERMASAEVAQQLDHVDYDIAIPSHHSYLDMTLTRVEGYNYWLEGQHVNLYMIPLDVIVIPGQTFPQRIRENTIQFTMVRALLDNRHKTFGAVYLPAEREQVLLGRSWSQCGVTVQILEVSDDNSREIVLKCKGRQRFKTISTQRRSVLTLHAKVQILADHIPPRLYDSMGRLRDPFKFGSHPSWLYKHHDVYAIMKSIKVEITKYSPLVKVDVAPTQPDMFSYWLISAMPFKFNQRVKMLRENSLVVRLKSQLEHIKDLNKFDYCCQLCGTDIVNSSRLVSMSADGPFFVNPAGIAFELITAYSVQHTLARGDPQTKDSWFPGYAWSYLSCLRCDSFLGWKFTAVVEDTQPRLFYGIQRKAVKVLRQRFDVLRHRNFLPVI